MRLFFKDEKPDAKEIHDGVSKAYGVKHPEQIGGYEGIFLFTLLDVYISERVDDVIALSPDFSETLNTLLVRFKKEDYGEVTKDEEWDNGEIRYLSSSPGGMLARYNTDFGVIIYESFFDMSLLYFEDEDVAKIRDEQNLKEKSTETLKTSLERLIEMEDEQPGIIEHIMYYEDMELPPCPKCGSGNTAVVNVGIVRRTLYLAAATRKFHLRANGRPGDYYCNVCKSYF